MIDTFAVIGVGGLIHQFKEKSSRGLKRKEEDKKRRKKI
jgi:hypothetical protein